MRKRSRKTLPQEEFLARLYAEKARLQRHYCTTFKFWRSCRFRRCRKARACCGDQNACLKQGLEGVPRHTQWMTRQRILEAGTPNLGAPERTAREFMPWEFYATRLVYKPGSDAAKANR